MRNPQRALSLAAITFAALAVSACGSGASTSDGPEKVRMASYVQESTALGQALQHWADETSACADGQIEFEPFYNGSLFGATEIRDAVQARRAEIGHFAPGYHPGEFPLTDGLLAVPFVATNMPAVMDSFMELYRTTPETQAEWNNQGMHLLAVLPGSPSAFGTETQVETLDDLAGLQIRGYSGGGLNAGLEAAGATPVDLELTELPEGMQRGVVDGFTGLTIDGITSLSLHENTPYLTDAGFGISGTIDIAVNQEWWDGLSENVQNCATEAADGLVDPYMDMVAEAETAACEAFRDEDMELTVLPDSEQEAWQDLVGDQQMAAWSEDASSSVDDPEGYFGNYQEIISAAEAEHQDFGEAGVQRCLQ
ncbi:TRAP transporter substrate-binding protein DctP [Citricoccus nitrophenolicus]